MYSLQDKKFGRVNFKETQKLFFPKLKISFVIVPLPSKNIATYCYKTKTN
jgi:hypothetical protein